MENDEKELQDFLGEKVAGDGAVVAIEAPEEIEPSDYPIELDAFDLDLIDEMRELSGEWRNTEEAREPELEGFPLAMDSVFGALWKPTPDEVPEEQLTARGKRIKKILDIAQELPEWKQLRQDTILDDVASAMATIAVGRAVQIPEAEEGEDGEDSEEKEPKSEEEQRKEEGQIRRSLRKALKQAQNEVEDQKMADQLGWGDEPGQGREVPAKERIAIGRKLRDNDRIRMIAQMVGKYRRVAASVHSRKVKYAREQIVSIKLGDDIPNMLQSELVYLADPDLELLFLSAYVEQSLLIYEKASNEKVGKGAIVARIDCSLSMADAMIGTNATVLDWAVAVTLALAVIAQKEERDLNLGFFSDRVVKAWSFPKGRLNPNDVLEIAQWGPQGGTNFNAALRDGIDAITTTNPERASAQEPDIVMITDGIAEVSEALQDEVIKLGETKKLDVFTYFVGPGRSNTLTRISRGTQHIKTMTDANDALDMAYGI